MSQSNQQSFSVLISVFIIGTIIGIRLLFGNTIFIFIKHLLFS